MALDVVDFMLQEFKSEIPAITDEQLQQIEDKTRHEWGGDDAYISKKKIRAAQKERAVNQYIGGDSLKDIKKQTGVARATLYRHLKK